MSNIERESITVVWHAILSVRSTSETRLGSEKHSIGDSLNRLLNSTISYTYGKINIYLTEKLEWYLKKTEMGKSKSELGLKSDFRFNFRTWT